jgi:hypothetical protein
LSAAKARGLVALLNGDKLQNRLGDLFSIEFATPQSVFLPPITDALTDYLKSGNSPDFDSIVDSIRQRPLIKKAAFELPLRFGETSALQGNFTAGVADVTAEGDLDFEISIGLGVPTDTPLFGTDATLKKLNFSAKAENGVQEIQFQLDVTH